MGIRLRCESMCSGCRREPRPHADRAGLAAAAPQCRETDAQLRDGDRHGPGAASARVRAAGGGRLRSCGHLALLAALAVLLGGASTAAAANTTTPTRCSELKLVPVARGNTAELILETGVPLLAIVLLGWACAHFRVFPKDQAVPILNKFVFAIAIPATVFRGLAIQDFDTYEPLGFWDFVLVFLLLRVFAGVLAAVVAVLGEFRRPEAQRDYIGAFLVHYIASTWMNTIIFGIPIVISIYGPAFQVYNVLASISSLIFQLPLMLALFEIRAGIRARAASAANADMELEWDGGVGNGNGAASASATNGTNGATALSLPGDQGVAPTATDTDAPKTPWEHEGYKAAPGSGSGGGHRHERRQSPLHLTAYILRRVVTTPPMIGILLGILWSGAITTREHECGEVYDMTDYVEKFVVWLGDTVTPLAAFTVGFFMSGCWSAMKKNWVAIVVYLVLKMVVLPLLVLGCAEVIGLPARLREIAVLIAALPIAMASFTLARAYGLGTEIMAGCIVAGTLLMIPVALLWDWLACEIVDCQD